MLRSFCCFSAQNLILLCSTIYIVLCHFRLIFVLFDSLFLVCFVFFSFFRFFPQDDFSFFLRNLPRFLYPASSLIRKMRKKAARLPG